MAKVWNKGRVIGAKPPLDRAEVADIRRYLKRANATRDLAMFNVAIDSQLRGSDLVRLRVMDVTDGSGDVLDEVSIRQKKTKGAVKFALQSETQDSVAAWIKEADLIGRDPLFDLSTRQYARLVKGWIEAIGLSSDRYGTHSLRRTKASIIYAQTGNLRAVQLLLGHASIANTARYLGVEQAEAIEISRKIKI